MWHSRTPGLAQCMSALLMSKDCSLCRAWLELGWKVSTEKLPVAGLTRTKCLGEEEEEED